MLLWYMMKVATVTLTCKCFVKVDVEGQNLIFSTLLGAMAMILEQIQQQQKLQARNLQQRK